VLVNKQIGQILTRQAQHRVVEVLDPAAHRLAVAQFDVQTTWRSLNERSKALPGRFHPAAASWSGGATKVGSHTVILDARRESRCGFAEDSRTSSRIPPE